MSKEQWWNDIDRENPKRWEQNLSYRQSVHQAFHTDRLGIEVRGRRLTDRAMARSALAL